MPTPTWSLRRLGLLGVTVLTVTSCLNPQAPRATDAVSTSPAAADEPVSYDSVLKLDFDTVTGDLVTGAPIAGTGPASLGAIVTTGGPTPVPLTTMPGARGGQAIRFMPVCGPPLDKCPKAIIEVPDTPLLNPGIHQFQYGASVLLTAAETAKGSNVLQKGFSTDGQGQWKLQVDGNLGMASCVLADTSTYEAIGTTTVADGVWHQVTCVRGTDKLSIIVDGTAEASVAIPPGLRITPVSPMRIGGKNIKPDNDQFFGAMDDVFVDVAKD